MRKYDPKHHAREVYEQGYTVLEALYDEHECEQTRVLLDRACEESGGFSPEKHSMGFHPLFHWAPDIAPFYANPVVAETAAEILQDDPRLALAGSLIVNTKYVGPIISGWHHHHNDWELPGIGPNRDHPLRIVFLAYPDGTDTDVGQLVVLPRQLNEPVEFLGDVNQDWPEQRNLSIPRGSVVFCDSPLLHCSRRGTVPGIRRLWGGHLQAWHYERKHPEDADSFARPTSLPEGRVTDLRRQGVETVSDNPRLAAHVDRLPVLRGMLERTGAN